MTDNILTALTALEREFNATTAMRAELANNILVVHVTMQEAFHGKPWRIEWSINDAYFEGKVSVNYSGDDSFWWDDDDCDPDDDCNITRQEAKRILNTSTMRVEAPATITDGTIDPDTQRMLDFATNLDYLTATGKSTVLPVRLVWEL